MMSDISMLEIDAAGSQASAYRTLRPKSRLFTMLCVLLILASLSYALPNTKGRKQMNKVEWGKVTEDLAISLSAAEPRYGPRDTITLNIALKNFGNTPVPIVMRSPWIDYTLSVRYDETTDIPKTAYAQQMIESAAEGRRANYQLKPGEVLTESIELSKAYDVKAHGLYKVVATRETYEKGKLDRYATVTSNELTIEIIP